MHPLFVYAQELIFPSKSRLQSALIIISLISTMQEDEYNYEEYNEYNEEGYNEEEEVPGQLEHNNFSHEPPMDEVIGQLCQEQPFEILPLVRLYSELDQILEEIQGLVYLDKGWCLILLKNFKWDKDYLREEFYNRNEEYLKAAGFEGGLDRPQQIDRGVEGTCEVCCLQKLPLFFNICGHRFCMECWVCHLKSSIQSGSAFPRCMDSECGRPVLRQTITGLLQRYGEEGTAWVRKYEKKICEMFITTNRNYQFCTGVDCGNCIKVNTKLDTVECNCGKIFCFRCQSDDHYPCKCEQKAKWVQQVLKEEADAKWISQNAKICPWCKKAVERSMGCNFMACTCGKNFCYMCSQPWQPDHKDHFKCHIFKKRPDDQVNREREIMQRMNHCTERYVFNQAVANNYKEIDIFSKRKYLFKALHIDLTESEFMENAYRFAIECCEKLKWIYAFTYFYDIKIGKDAFEFSLGEYERYKENLLKLLAADLKKFMMTVEQCDNSMALCDSQVVDELTEQFKSLKKQIVNYYTCTKNYKDKFVAEVNHIMERLNDLREKEEMEKDMQQRKDKKQEPQSKTETKQDKKLKRKKSKKEVIQV